MAVPRSRPGSTATARPALPVNFGIWAPYVLCVQRKHIRVATLKRPLTPYSADGWRENVCASSQGFPSLLARLPCVLRSQQLRVHGDPAHFLLAATLRDPTDEIRWGGNHFLFYKLKASV